MNSGVNSQKLFYVISSFFLLVLIIFTLRVNYASSASNVEDGALKTFAANMQASSPAARPQRTDAVKNAEGEVSKPEEKETSAEEKNAPAASGEVSAAPAASAAPDSIASIISVEKIKKMPGDFSIVVDKSRYLLKLYKGGKLVKKYKVAIGRNPDGADKKSKGDLRTPEGNFHIVSIHKSDKWLHEGKYAYGPWFLRLKTPWQGIGIHGTDEPESLGKKASEGCIRLHSDCIAELKKLVEDQVTKSKKKVKVDVFAKCEGGEDE